MRGVRSVVIVVVLGLLAGRAAATPADDSFERGRVLMAEGKIAEACAAFEDSLKLDFQLGTLFNLAGCNAQRGKLATALAAYRRIQNEDKNSQRADRSRELADQLAPRVPTLAISLANPHPATEVILDGATVDPSKPVPVDLGTHEIAIRSPGRVEVKRSIEVTREGERVPVAYDLTSTEGQPQPRVGGVILQKRSRAPIVVIGAGALTVGAGLVLGALALRGWHDAESTAELDPTQANRDLGGVRKLGNASTGLVIAGVLTAGVGFYLRW
jgi:hypothetical protein